MKVHSLATLILFLVLPGLLLAGDGPAPKSKGASKGKGKGKGEPAAATATGTAVSSAMENMAAMIPEGLRNEKVRIPGFENGKATSLVLADAMTRHNDKSLFAEGVVLHLYAEDPKENLRVDMKTATYHLDTKILTSDERTKVGRADFQMEGDSMIYDTTTGKGQMKGHVHTVIFDTSAFAPKKKEEPAADSKAALAPPPPQSKTTPAP